MKSSLGWLVALVAASSLLPSAHADDATAQVGVNGQPVLDSDDPVETIERAVEETQHGLPVNLPTLVEEAADALPGPDKRDSSTPVGGVQAEDQAPDLVDRLTEPEAAATLTGLALLMGALTYAGLFSRIQPNRMLENDARNRVFEAVTQNPGVTIKEIAAVCSIGWGTAVYHLERLESERLIVSERNRQFRRFFKNGSAITNRSRAGFSELKNPMGQRIADTILATPGSCQKDVCARVGISPPLAHKYLARLEAAGLVSTQRDWKLVKYFPTRELEALILAAPPATTMQVAPPLVAAA